MGWDEETRAYRLDTAFVPGRPVALLHPFRPQSAEFEELSQEVMKPLQARLIEAGLDGVVWQAGKGNPVALNNFLLDGSGTGSYVMIDLESGVPALFPADFGAFFSFYLAKSLRHRRPLFDDVDTDKLMGYLAAQRASLEATLGEGDYRQLVALTEDLAGRQAAWKGLSRIQRSIRYALKKGHLSPEEARWFTAHPLRWLAREGGRLLLRALHALFVRLPAKVGALIAGIGVRRALAAAWRFMVSPAYRLELARGYVTSRIEAWREREQLTNDEAERLTSQLSDPGNSHKNSYLTDFGVHLGLKVLVQTLEYTIFAALLLTGVIGLATFGLLFALDGPILRTLYTGFRIVRPAAEAQERPWVALVLGLVPFFGTLAYPGQMIYSARGEGAELGKFIVYDSFGRLGQKLPILGGKDTQTEHVFNRLARWVLGQSASS